MHVFEALADPTRRRIVESLRKGMLPVGDIVDAVGIHQSGVSRHLRILLQAGVVDMRADGSQHYYGLCPEPFRELEKWLGQYHALWNERLDRLQRALVRRQQLSQSAKKKT